MQGSAHSPWELLFKDLVKNHHAGNKIWTPISGDLRLAQLIVGKITIDPNAKAEASTYTVKAGDTLSKIAKEHLGNANAYMKIFEAIRTR